MVPAEVSREIEAGRKSYAAIPSISSLSWARLAVLDYDEEWTKLLVKAELAGKPDEHLGECAVIAVSKHRSGVAIIDDRSAYGQGLADDAARAVIRERGFGEYFFHRTGHSIGAEVHGSGANMDNLETHDVRRVIPWTCFSIEPGVYLPNFGVRSEVNVFVGEDGARVTGEIQDRIVLI